MRIAIRIYQAVLIGIALGMLGCESEPTSAQAVERLDTTKQTNDIRRKPNFITGPLTFGFGR